MNRRSFLKLLAALGFLPLAGCLKDKEPSMQIGDILARLASGDRLTSAEVEYLRLKMNDVESSAALVSGWTKGGTTSPHFPYLQAQQATFDQPALNGLVLARYDLFSVANGATPTAVQWQYRFGKSEKITWSPLNPTRIIPNPTLTYLFCGRLTVFTGPTRARIWLDSFILNDLPLSIDAGLGYTTVPFLFFMNFNYSPLTNDGYFEIGLTHDFGSARNITMEVFIFPITSGALST